jgi:O-antigen/teichoic acid export membrane protein
LVISFFLAPVLVHGLGDERNGIWSLVESILAYLMLFDLGVAASVVRYVARFETTRDWDKLNRIFSTSLIIFGMAGALTFFVAWALAFPFLETLGVASELRPETRGMLILLGFNLAAGLPLGVFPCVLDGLGKYPTKTILRSALLLVRTVIFVVIMKQEGGLIELAWAITICNLAEHLLMGVAAWWYLPGLRFSFSYVDRATFRTIRGYSVDAFLAMVAGRISFQTDAVVIGSFLSARFITFFTISARLVEYAKNAVRALTTVLVPAISSLEARGDTESIRQVLVDGTRYVLWIIIPVEAALVLLGKPFLALWMGARYVDLCYPTLVILTIPLALAMAQSVAARVLYGMGRLRWYARAVMAEGAINLLLSMALVRPLGIEGVALGTCIPNGLNNILIMAYVCRFVGLDIGLYVRRAWILPTGAGMVLAAGWWIIGTQPATPTWTWFLVTVSVGVSVYWGFAALIEIGREPVIRRLQYWMGYRASVSPLVLAEDGIHE